MAVYSKLLLSTGGGIVSKTQQADQVRNSATILIGLGGTGIDCLRTIKTQVYARLKPDDKNAIIPTYEHIRFLGIDTTEKSRGSSKEMNALDDPENKLSLDDSEFFSIADTKLSVGFKNKLAMEMREDLTWMRWEDIPIPDLGSAGAGGVRQVGRYMMMNNSVNFISRIEQEITAAKMGLNNPVVNIHIFSGLSGGTGSGCFLDVCYMIQSALQQTNEATMFGYFFLPDVNLSKIPHQDSHTRAFIPKNGYAAMQELDYCMQLQFNGGSFAQEYRGKKKIEWRKPPVDMCHLISATDTNGNIIPKAYDYAMNVTTEYIMDFLTRSENAFGLSEHQSNFRQKIATADSNKIIGSHLAYCVIGAACANIPLKEINTYLASELFDKYAQIKTNLPTKAQVEEVAVRALAKHSPNVFDAIFRELREGANDDFVEYPGDFKYVKDYGNHDMVEHYTNQKAAKLNKVEANAKSMMDMQNEHSLINRLRQELTSIIRDLEKGPVFANGILQGAKTHNLLNIIDGLLEENKKKLEQEAYQHDLRNSDYDEAKDAFEKAKIGSRKKKFENYDFYCMSYVQHDLKIGVFQQMGNVLETLREQVVKVSADYYVKLSRVVSTLVDTFKENRDSLESMRFLKENDSFSIPMMTIDELKETLDKEIKTLNIAQSLNAFMNIFLTRESEWISEDENKITRLVTEFFVEQAFENFSSKTITSYLKDKYDVQNEEQLANIVYEDWMKILTTKANPLFLFNNAVWDESRTSKLAYLSIPEISMPIKKAAEMIYKVDNLWNIKSSGLVDRIFVMSSACALPLSSYSNCSEYEHDYFNGSAAGTHYYEGKLVQGMKFNDWRKLPSLTPQCLIELDKVPEPLKEIILPAQQLFDRACELHVFNVKDNTIYKPDENAVQSIKENIALSQQLLENISTAQPMEDILILKTKLQLVDQIPMISTNVKLANDGYAGEMEKKRSIAKDYFVSSPVYHMMVREIINELQTLKEDAAKIMLTLEEKVTNVNKNSADLIDYCNGLFTGVITIEGNVISYTKTEFGVESETILSKNGAEYAYKGVPIYQGYLTYQTLDDAVKREIIARNDEILNGSFAAIAQGCRTLKDTQLTDLRIHSWVQTANNYPNKDEIKEMLKKFVEQFHIFCASNMID